MWKEQLICWYVDSEQMLNDKLLSMKLMWQTCKNYREHTALVSVIWLHYIFTISCRVRMTDECVLWNERMSYSAIQYNQYCCSSVSRFSWIKTRWWHPVTCASVPLKEDSRQCPQRLVQQQTGVAGLCLGPTLEICLDSAGDCCTVANVSRQAAVHSDRRLTVWAELTASRVTNSWV